MSEEIREEAQQEKKSILQKLGLKKEERKLTAQIAFYETTHGIETYIPVSQRIKEKQESIEATIRSKFLAMKPNGGMSYYSFCCMVSVEEDLLSHCEDIFKPFIESGFEVINLSKNCDFIDEEGIFYVSWLNAFKDSEKRRVML